MLTQAHRLGSNNNIWITTVGSADLPASSVAGAFTLGDLIINTAGTAGATWMWVCTGNTGSPLATLTWSPTSTIGQTLSTLIAVTGDGALGNHAPSKNYIVTKGSAALMTLAAPTATTDDGTVIRVFSSTAFAHTITATGLLQTGSASVNVATFAAFAGASVELVAYNAKWLVQASNGITFS